MVIVCAIVKLAQLDSDGLSFTLDISSLDYKVNNRELRAFDASAPTDVLEAALIARIEKICREELGLTIDADHTVRLLTKLR